jgi:hypothetical protein
VLVACLLGACTQLIESGDATYASTSRAPGLVSSGSRDGDNFGTALVLQDDELIVVAATAELTKVRSTDAASCGETIDAINAGRIHSFELEEQDWIEGDELKRDAAATNEGLITSAMFATLPRISIARAGRTVAIGIPAAPLDCREAETAIRNAGKVIVFENYEERWSVRQVLTASEPTANLFFGSNLAFTGDRLFVAAPGDGSPMASGDGQQRDQSGAVYVFERDVDLFFVEAQRITPSNAVAGAQFGSAVGADGDVLAVGAWFDSHGDRGINAPGSTSEVEGSGAAYVFRERDGRWEEEAYIKAFNRESGDLFGMSIAVQGDIVLVGAPFEAGGHKSAKADSVDELDELDDNDAVGAGAVYAFTRESDGWRFDSYIKAFDPRSSSAFGVALTFKAGRLLVGAPYESALDATGDTVISVGAAYLYERDASSFLPVTTFRPVEPRLETLFGFAADLDGDTVAIGAPENMRGRGSVSIFDLRGPRD